MRYGLVAISTMDTLAVGTEGDIIRRMTTLMEKPNAVEAAIGRRAARLEDFAIMAQEDENSKVEAIDPFVFLTSAKPYYQDLIITRHRDAVFSYGRLYQNYGA